MLTAVSVSVVMEGGRVRAGGTAAALLALLLVLGGCTGGTDDGAVGATPDPATARAEPPLPTAEEAAASLQTAMRRVRDRVVAVAAELDQTRHLLPRGRPVTDAAALVFINADALEEAITAADAVAAEVAGQAEAVTEDASETDRANQRTPAEWADGGIARGAEVLQGAADAARGVLRRGREEAEMWRQLGDLDVRMDHVVADWEDRPPGSGRPADDFGALLGEAAAIAEDAAAVTPVPARCPDHVDLRGQWARTLEERTQALTDALAAGADPAQAIGDARRDPYGADRLAQDAERRLCWGVNSQVANGASWIAGQEVILAQTLDLPVPPFAAPQPEPGG
jgi:hypothetical protein